MSRVALLADIHGNRIALDAVLHDLATRDVTQIVCLGDVAATGPQPRETVERLRNLECPVVMGNADAWLLDPRDDPQGDETTQIIETIDRWCAEQLGAELLGWVATFQPAISVVLEPATDLLCFHGSPRSNTDIIRATTPPHALDAMLGGTTATYLAGGHTHERMLRRYGARTLLNPGSVGLPSDPEWAEYAILSAGSTGQNVEFHRVRFALEQLIAAAREADMPHLDWWQRMLQAA
jgi:predicted phosphodiesterase